MTHTTEQERAEFEAWLAPEYSREKWHTGEYTDDTVFSMFAAWQAARRAQVVPDAYIVYAKGSTRYWVVTLNPHDVPEIYKGGETVPLYRNAAAPQPPDAAPVLMPEYGIDTANHAGIRVRGYTEHQVLAILAQHGIKTK